VNVSENDLGEQPRGSSARSAGPAGLRTPGATAIAGFAFAVFSMLGQGSWSASVTALFWGSNYPMGSVDRVMVAWGASSLLMAALALWLAFRTLVSTQPHEPWAAHLARAAVLVAGVGVVLAVLAIVGGFLH
jgi:hypothetical protein